MEEKVKEKLNVMLKERYKKVHAKLEKRDKKMNLIQVELKEFKSSKPMKIEHQSVKLLKVNLRNLLKEFHGPFTRNSFEAAAQTNGWSDDEKDIAHMTAFRGKALDVLQGILDDQ